jgi:hypothetical protein
MSWSSYDGNGVLREHGDDVAQTVTDFNADGSVASTTPYTAAQIAQAQANASAQAHVTDFAARLVLLEQYVFGIKSPSATAPAWSSTGTYPPGATVQYGNVTYINQSGAWLNGFYIPGDALHPFWSAQPSTSPIPWVVGMSLTQGMYVSNGAHTYQWASPAVASAPANYAPTGTVSTASWTFIN